MNTAVPRLWCHGSCPAFLRLHAFAEQWYLPLRPACLLESQDLIMLPSHSLVRDFISFVVRRDKLNESQVIWTSGARYLLDDDIGQDEHVRKELTTRCSPGSVIMPYSVTPEFMAWRKRFPQLDLFGENPSVTKRFGHKGALHPQPFMEEKSVFQSRFPKIRVACGFTCANVDELLEAARRITLETGEDRYVIKPVDGSSGDGILFVKREDLRSYGFPFGAVVLEEHLTIDLDSDGRALAPSIQFDGQEVLGECLDQVLRGVEFAGNRSPSQTMPTFQTEVVRLAKTLTHGMSTRGPGGFDTLAVNGRPVLIDLNIGRYTGAHYPKKFVQKFAPRSAFWSWKPSTLSFSIEELWQRFCAQGLAFEQGGRQTGVFPLYWLPEIHGMLIAIGSNQEEVRALHARAEAILQSS